MGQTNTYPVLKTMLLLLPNQNNDDAGGLSLLGFNAAADELEVYINRSHLIVGFSAPEVSPEVESILTRANLRPYEHSVSKFGTADHKYDLSAINLPEKRKIKGINRIIDLSPVTSVYCPLIISYLQFETI